MERAEANQNAAGANQNAGPTQNTASTSTPSWSHVVRGSIQSHEDMKQVQSPSPSTTESQSAGELVFLSESEVWPALGEAPTRSPPNATANTTFPITSLVKQDNSTSDVVGHRVSHKVEVSQVSERDRHVPPLRNAPNRPFFSQGSETNGYVPPVRNLPNRPFLSQGSETSVYVPEGRSAPNRPLFTHGSETSVYVPAGRSAPNRPLFTQSSETNGYIPQGMNAPNRSFFSPNTNMAHSMDQHYRGHGYPPRGGNGNVHNIHDQRQCPPRRGYRNMHNNMHDQREYNYNWNSQQDFHEINNVATYQQFGPMNNTRQPPNPQVPIVDGITNPFYMNVAPMPYYFPQPAYLDASSGGPCFMAPLPPVPAISQNNTDLRKKIVKQVDYYFSTDNLSKDIHLRKHMDEYCWVAISVVAGFKKMTQLTYDVNLILDALGDSTVVELKGDKIRRRNDWFHWPNPDFIVGLKKEGHVDGSSSSETASELETSERVFPEKDTLDDELNPKKDD